MQLILRNQVIFLDKLTYLTALTLQNKAKESYAVNYYNFEISQNADGSWVFYGMVKEIDRAFIRNPEGFIIEI